MTSTHSLALVEAWIAAANSQDLPRLLALSAPDIALVGPRGIAHGHQPLQEWLARAGLTLTTERRFVRADQVVLAQQGVWRAPQDNQPLGQAAVASFFQVNATQVIHYARYDDLATALTAAGLTHADEIANDY